MGVIYNPIPSKGPSEHSIFHSNTFLTRDGLDTLRKQDVFQRQNPISPCTSSSSPTALGLLLKSSLFKELMERNLNDTDKETEVNETKLPLYTEIDNEVGGNFWQWNRGNHLSVFCWRKWVGVVCSLQIKCIFCIFVSNSAIVSLASSLTSNRYAYVKAYTNFKPKMVFLLKSALRKHVYSAAFWLCTIDCLSLNKAVNGCDGKPTTTGQLYQHFKIKQLICFLFIFFAFLTLKWLRIRNNLLKKWTVASQCQISTRTCTVHVEDQPAAPKILPPLKTGIPIVPRI